MRVKIKWTNEDDEFEFDAEGDFSFEQAHELISEVLNGDVEQVTHTLTLFVPEGSELSEELVDEIFNAFATDSNADPTEDTAEPQDEPNPEGDFD